MSVSNRAELSSDIISYHFYRDTGGPDLTTFTGLTDRFGPVYTLEFDELDDDDSPIYLYLFISGMAV